MWSYRRRVCAGPHRRRWSTDCRCLRRSDRAHTARREERGKNPHVAARGVSRLTLQAIDAGNMPAVRRLQKIYEKELQPALGDAYAGTSLKEFVSEYLSKRRRAVRQRESRVRPGASDPTLRQRDHEYHAPYHGPRYLGLPLSCPRLSTRCCSLSFNRSLGPQLVRS